MLMGTSMTAGGKTIKLTVKECTPISMEPGTRGNGKKISSMVRV